jgi:citrate synthase
LLNLDPRVNIARIMPPAQRLLAPQPADYLSRTEALRILRVKPQTLYCYVSRGFIRRVPQPAGRSSFYLREDVEKMRARSTARAGHGPAAASAMRWGAPAILTAVTEITDRGPRYRERLALDLARARCPFENVAEYLWTGTWLDEALRWRAEPAPAELRALLAAQARLNPGMHILQRLTATVLALGAAEGSRGERLRSGGTSVSSARRLVRAMAGVFGFLGPGRAYVPLLDEEPVARGLARAIGLAASERRVQALNAALVLAADHELNPATFAARIAASGEADLHSCIGAAMNVHTGGRIGSVPDRVERLFTSGVRAKAVVAAARRMLASAERLPGFNHPLYPHGDPRAELMIELTRAAARGQQQRAMLEEIDRLKQELGQWPTIEGGLVVLCRGIGAPDGTAAGLFALGRVAGWTAHVLEQRLQGFMIRPRAKFVGTAAMPQGTQIGA